MKVYLRLKRPGIGAFHKALSTQWSEMNLDAETIATLGTDTNVEISHRDPRPPAALRTTGDGSRRFVTPHGAVTLTGNQIAEAEMQGATPQALADLLARLDARSPLRRRS